MRLETARKFALSLPETTEEPHFEKSSFRVKGKIMATVPLGGKHLHLNVEADEGHALCEEFPEAFEPIQWGKRVQMEWIRVTLAKADRAVVEELLEDAWRRMAPKRLVADYDLRSLRLCGENVARRRKPLTDVGGYGPAGMAEMVSYARRFTELAAVDPERVLITCGDDSITRAGFEAAANRLARDLQARGVGVGDMVTIALPNSIEWFVTAAAAWKVGAIPQPVSYRLPDAELQAIVELADSRIVAGVEPERLPGRSCLPAGYVPHPSIEDSPLPDVTSPAWKAPTSGGSTGRPKLIVAGDPATMDAEARPTLGVDPDGCLLMPGPLYHNGPVVWSCTALLAGAHLVVLPRFDAEATLAAIEEHSVDVVYLVPTMMKRIWRLPLDVRERYDLSSLRFVWHLAEPCPPWLKEAWIEWLGAEKIWELYAGTEGQTATIITGPEWLEHRGSVGKPAEGSVLITDDDGNELAPGEQGEVWLRSTTRDTPSYRYVGAEARAREGGWESLGDVGWIDEDGFLYLGDRLTDMVLSGGANIYPAEVEAALQEHPDVHSCAVIGLPDEDMGQRVHAIVEADTSIDLDGVQRFLGERLASYKLPRSFEVVSEPLRDDAGKVRRSALRAERVAP